MEVRKCPYYLTAITGYGVYISHLSLCSMTALGSVNSKKLQVKIPDIEALSACQSFCIFSEQPVYEKQDLLSVVDEVDQSGLTAS